MSKLLGPCVFLLCLAERMTADGRYNQGGRDILPRESPNGRLIQAGSRFAAPVEWYKQRNHWYFLEKIEPDEEERAKLLAELEGEEPTCEEQVIEGEQVRALESFTVPELRELCQDEGISDKGTKAELVARLRAHIAAALEEEQEEQEEVE